MKHMRNSLSKQKNDLGLLNSILKQFPEILKYIKHDIPHFVEGINSKNYRSVQKRFGKQVVETLMSYYISKEDYQECVRIRDRYKKKKATSVTS